MADLPDGVVTFVFTDVEGSTRMWEDSPDLMMRALEQHDGVIDEAVRTHGGVSVKPRGEGDSRFLVFTDAGGAVEAVAQIQAALAEVEWATPEPIVIRAALHTGAADLQLGDYYGPAVNRAARLRAIAHGGQTVLSASTWELVQDRLPPEVLVRDMGEHGLKDLARPEHVYEMCVHGLPDEFPPLASLNVVPNNLPIQLTELVGRQTDVAEAERLLNDTRLLTIMAPGGTGKTRLAIQVAAEVIADYPDGVFFVNLADVGLSRDIVPAIAESLELAPSTSEDATTQLLTYLAHKRQLLVFDNFEHLTDGAPIVTSILQRAPGVKVIVTSRVKLNLTGETAFTLGGLETEWLTPDEATQASGVQLFLDAATRAHPGFTLEPADVDALGSILGATGGLPLAILLAAAWVDMLPVGEIASEIAKNLDFLETEVGDVPDRHRSVRAVFDYSWALLDEREREAFVALSVFRGGFSREAAESVAGASLRTLANLVNKSLVTASPESGRYVVHELLRQYARAQLEGQPETAAAVADAHAAFYASLMDEGMRLFVVTDQLQMFSMLADDLDNIRAAWRHYLAAGNAADARRFIEGLTYLDEIRGWYPMAIDLFGEALESFDADTDDPDEIVIRALAGAVQAWYTTLMGRPDAGVDAAAEATEIMRGTDDLVGYLTAAQCWAISLAYLGRMDEMAACMDAAMAAADAAEDPFWSAGARNWRAFCAVNTGDVAMAETLLAEASRVFEPQDEHYFRTWTLWLQAMLALQGGRPLEAIELHTEQVAVCREFNYMRGTQVALEGLGDAALAAERLEEAEAAFIEAMTFADKMGIVLDMLGLMAKVAGIRGATGRPEEAVELLSTVRADPRSAGQTFTSNAPITDVATEALEKLSGDLAADAYEAAHTRGASTEFEVAAKALMSQARVPSKD